MGTQLSGFTREEAERMRLIGHNIVACWWCLFESGRDSPKNNEIVRPYWPWEQTQLVGAMIACPKHWMKEGFGNVQIGELPPL